MGRYSSNNPSSSNSRIASKRSQSLTQRCTSGSVSRRRSGRGGKSRALSPNLSLLLALAKLQPEQKTIGQHHRYGVAMETIPTSPLMLIPTQFAFRFFMVLLDPMAAMRVLDHLLQRRPRREVAPIVFPGAALTTRRTLADQPPDVACAGAIHAPAAERNKLGAQTVATSLAPTDRLPITQRLRIDHFIGALDRPLLTATECDTEVRSSAISGKVSLFFFGCSLSLPVTYCRIVSALGACVKCARIGSKNSANSGIESRGACGIRSYLCFH